MAVIRPPLPTDNFVSVPNAWARDHRLDYAAKGMLAYILSHAPGYRLTMEQMIDESTSGRDAVRRILRDLERVGYLERTKVRDPQTGKQLGYDFALIAPIDGVPTDGKPVGGPDQAEQPISAGQDQSGFSVAGSAPPEKTTEKSHEENEHIDKGASRKVSRGTRVPEGFQPDEAMRKWFVAGNYSRWINGLDQHEQFMDYWKAQPGQKGVKLDWPATWRRWMRTAAERAQERGVRPAGPAPRQRQGGYQTSAEKTQAKNDEEAAVSAVFDELAAREGLDRRDWAAVQALSARAREIVQRSTRRQGDGYTGDRDIIDAQWTETTPREVTDHAA